MAPPAGNAHGPGVFWLPEPDHRSENGAGVPQRARRQSGPIRAITPATRGCAERFRVESG